MQQELRIMGQVNSEMADLPWELVAQCRTIHAAYRLTIHQSKVYRRQEDLAQMLSFKHRGTLNRILNCDQRPENRDEVGESGPDFIGEQLGTIRQVKLQKLCRNNGIRQWVRLYETGMLNCQKSKQTQEAELLRALEQLRRQA